jgi:hypothetical protein
LVEIRGKITKKKKPKFLGQLVVELKTFTAKDLFGKGVELWGSID